MYLFARWADISYLSLKHPMLFSRAGCALLRDVITDPIVQCSYAYIIVRIGIPPRRERDHAVGYLSKLDPIALSHARILGWLKEAKPISQDPVMPARHIESCSQLTPNRGEEVPRGNQSQ
jgi:hypothetical protein